MTVKSVIIANNTSMHVYHSLALRFVGFFVATSALHALPFDRDTIHQL